MTFFSYLFFYSLSFFFWQYYKCIHHTLITSPYFSLFPPILYMHTLHTDCPTPTLASFLPPTILYMHTLHPDPLTPTLSSLLPPTILYVHTLHPDHLTPALLSPPNSPPPLFPTHFSLTFLSVLFCDPQELACHITVNTNLQLFIRA